MEEVRVYKMIKKYIKPYFFSSTNLNRIKPIRAIITLFLVLIIVAIVIKFFKPNHLSDTFVLGLFGGLGILLGADTWRSNTKTRNGCSNNCYRDDEKVSKR